MEFNEKHIQSIIGYSFRNVDLLQQAFTRRSYSEEWGGQNNEVLEFLGDKALDLAVIRIMAERFGVITETKEWYEFKLRNPRYYNTKKEGIFTDIKKDFVQSRSLARVIETLGLQEYLFMGEGDIIRNVQESTSVKEDLFEAIIGAVAIDSNWNLDDITEVVRTMIDFDSYFNNVVEDDNYTGELQRLFQLNDNDLPTYFYKEADEGFICHLTGYFNNYGVIADGYGSNKASARNNAARNALVDLRERGYVLNVYEEEVGKPSQEFALKQINELIQKKLIYKPKYTFSTIRNDEGKAMWKCEVDVPGQESIYWDSAFTKKEAQRNAVYCFLKDLMCLEGNDND